MKDLRQYILEAEDDNKKTTERGKIKFVIWETPDKKLSWLNDYQSYQKIEAKYEEDADANKGLKVAFLLGRQDNSWKLWVGKIGVVSYSDDPYCDLKCRKFADAILNALDKADEIIKEIKENPNDWVQYYVDR